MSTSQIITIALAAVVIVLALAWCTVQYQDTQNQLDMARVAQGLCQGAWGTWEKCK